MKISVPTGIKAIVLVFIFLSLFLSEASSRETVYVFPPTYIGEEEGKLALAEEALREEINLYFDLAHNPSYEKLVVDFMKGNSDGILNQFFLWRVQRRLPFKPENHPSEALYDVFVLFDNLRQRKSD